MLSLTSFFTKKFDSAIAQWWSIRLLTEGLQVRVLLAEPKSLRSNLRLSSFMYTVYVLYSKNCNKIYIGQTADIERRLFEHNNGLLSYYTKRYIPWQIIYTEDYPARNEALKREKQLKSQKGREFIWNLIN